LIKIVLHVWSVPGIAVFSHFALNMTTSKARLEQREKQESLNND
jgi:hypothetical protein